MLLLLTLLFITIIIYLVYTNVISINNFHRSLLIDINIARAQRFGLILDVRTAKEREELGFYPDSKLISMEELKEEKTYA